MQIMHPFTRNAYSSHNFMYIQSSIITRHQIMDFIIHFGNSGRNRASKNFIVTDAPKIRNNSSPRNRFTIVFIKLAEIDFSEITLLAFFKLMPITE